MTPKITYRGESPPSFKKSQTRVMSFAAQNSSHSKVSPDGSPVIFNSPIKRTTTKIGSNNRSKLSEADDSGSKKPRYISKSPNTHMKSSKMNNNFTISLQNSINKLVQNQKISPKRFLNRKGTTDIIQQSQRVSERANILSPSLQDIPFTSITPFN